MFNLWRRNVLTLFLVAILQLLACQIESSAGEADPFTVKPYIQLGDNPHLQKPERHELTWLTAKANTSWKVEIKDAHGKWRMCKDKAVVRALPVIPGSTHYLVKCPLSDLTPGERFEYRVLANGSEVFKAEATARKSQEQKFKFAVVGDVGANSKGQRKVIYQCHKRQPDLLVVPGDIVYNNGLLSEYLRNFFPIENSDDAGPLTGAPLLRSTLTVGVIGNHDIALGLGSPTDFDRAPDALAYFYLWSNPLNGPNKDQRNDNAPPVKGQSHIIKSFLRAAGSSFPCAANFSFDYGNAHFLVLDANPYMDWTNERMRKWVQDDLKSHKHAIWKFVAFHQPGFSCDEYHAAEQRMRLLCDIFQDNGVDVVFSGHAHNYQRSHPLRFNVRRIDGKPLINADGTVQGEIKIDTGYDGVKNTRARAVLYIVTGAGGARLYRANLDTLMVDAAPVMVKILADNHSFTECDVDGETLKLRQINSDGVIIDEIVLTKPTP